MKTKILSLAILALASTSAAQAQVELKPTQDAAVIQQRSDARAAAMEERSTRMAKELGLSAEQAASMKEIDGRYAKAIADVRTSTTDRQEMMTRNEALRTQHEEEIKSLLTREQFNKLQEVRKADRQQAVQRRDAVRQQRTAE